MTDGQERGWAELAATYEIAVQRDQAETSILPGTVIDPAEVYGRVAPLVVEIGSGQGHAIIHAAGSRPDTDFLAVEVFRAGLARTMLDAERAGIDNLRIVEANAPEVLEHLLPAGSVDEVWMFFPDPWHKNKHTKRRWSPQVSRRSLPTPCAMAECFASRRTGRTTPARCGG